MSAFLPETMQPTPQAATVNFTSPATDSSGDVALMQRVLSAAVQNPSLIPPDFMAYVVDFIQTARLSIPIGQVFGFVQHAPGFVSVEAQDSTTSITFTDLANVGPEVDGIADGKFIVLWGASCFTSDVTKQALIALSVNGSVDITIYTEGQGASPFSVARGAVLTLANGGGNSVKCVYASGGAASTASFRHRWLILFRVSN